MNQIKENLMSNSIPRQASAKLKCIDSLTCVGKFAKLYSDWKQINDESLAQRMEMVYDDCVKYGLISLNNGSDI